MTSVETRMAHGVGQRLLGAFVLLLVAGLIQLAVFYPLIPDRVASHFGVEGRADGWTTKRSFFASVGGCYGVTALVFLATGYAVKRSPVRWISLPNKEYWTAPEREQQTRAWLYRHILWFGCSMLALLMVFHFLTCRANLRADQSMGPWPWVVMGVYLTWAVGWTARLILRFARIPVKNVTNTAD
ncbi:MAG TPA: DUF1648 domain-containing protein [Phycisphaerae bacterium]|jgi:uncharacterized membrane protein|nr:DUF1648 domain-containing protein [Phycisphaerae bacterium]HOB75674.1 DUF1648 domain-containing protein [Phycisphaerae bacterium]HOJ53286.1 DUF1648 domain-containing protein [Phycisphaerae bacterium]HOL27449.1 DUF1648 domain-containing protein [Phycisphaerae bacterium]HPP21645.1 DUF1648 domain-containing protein [Phycisphaerae bacterium]